MPSLVSVITPTYNGAPYLAETLESAIAQDYPAIEIIVADDGSTDGTREILRRFRDRIRILTLPHNGEHAARNAAIAASRGEYIAFLDHDDLWLPGKITRQVEALEANPRAGLCHTGYQPFDEQGPRTAIVHTGDAYRGYCFDIQFRANGIGALTVMVRRAALPEHLFYLDIPITADYALWLDIVFDHEVVYIPEVLAMHRRHAGQVTHGHRHRWPVYEAVSRMRLLARVRERMDPAEYRERITWTLSTLQAAAEKLRGQNDDVWADRGFQLLSQYRADTP